MSPRSLDEPWGRGFGLRHRHVFLDTPLEPPQRWLGREERFLPRGLGRSYGDVCLNAGGTLAHSFRRDRLLAFDPRSGLLTAEAGATIADIASVFLPRGWFPPVVPGTRFVTLGGAVANDIHGKNHAQAGTFGRHVTGLRLVRSDHDRPLELAPGDALFAATVGGLGLTGLIDQITLRLTRIEGAAIEQEVCLFHGLEAYHTLEAESLHWPFTVGWLDTLDPRLRGVFFRGRFVATEHPEPEPALPRRLPPIEPPRWLLGQATARAFNALYWRVHALGRSRRQQVSPWRFFWPLDALADWNRLYGRRGFIQYQFVVPAADAVRTIGTILTHLRGAGVASYLSVIKRFGALPSPGWLSFPLEGTTVTLDIPAPNAQTRAALDRADRMLLEAGGRLYPAKDARMRPEVFQACYPRWRELEALRDPAISSSFWRRVTAASG